MARTATVDAAQLERTSSSGPVISPREETPLLGVPGPSQPPPSDATAPDDEGPSLWQKCISRAQEMINPVWRRRSAITSAASVLQEAAPEASTILRSRSPRRARPSISEPKPRPGALPRPVGGTSKLGTFAGVFVPTLLNVLSVLMFLRFGFILGQTGVIGMLGKLRLHSPSSQLIQPGMLIACYAINLLTTMSISAIATNGTVRGGGAYYLISRSLGPEFGGSIGLVLYLGFVFNTSMNSVGLIDCFIENFGSRAGAWSQWLPESFWWQYLWATAVMMLGAAVCLAGSGLFARCSNGLLALLLLATLSIPLSALVVAPFENRREKITYTGLSFNTLSTNLLPRFTKHAAGSEIRGRESFQDLFGVLFPATGGIFAYVSATQTRV